ncbi:DUF397 domain-containing protein [Actinomadura sp. DSM 109109]|nr:DUF397 domain-containing protein [Actinomadura lepetitiana]
MGLNAVIWRKSSRSHDDGDACVEIATDAEGVAVRDSKDPWGPRSSSTVPCSSVLPPPSSSSRTATGV